MFTGKTTSQAITSLPESAEDVADIVGIVAPYEAPLLCALGDPPREATDQNHGQVLSSMIKINRADLACKRIDLADELDYQKQEQLRKLLRALEEIVAMRAISFVSTNIFRPGDGGFPAGDVLDGEKLNYALGKVQGASSGRVDLIVVNGFQMRAINEFTNAVPSALDVAAMLLLGHILAYESDFGTCRVILSRGVPPDSVLLLDSSRVAVLPVAGRSFHFKPMASMGDYEGGELAGEYTTELKDESAHGLILGLKTN